MDVKDIELIRAVQCQTGNAIDVFALYQICHVSSLLLATLIPK